MALLHTCTLQTGISLPEAYTRVTSATYTKNELTVGVSTWASERARLDELTPVSTASYTLPWLGDISMTYLYDQLKLITDFVEATDA